MKIALRTQQVIAEETRIPNVVDPLGGSWYVEALTNEFEAAVLAILAKVDELGGTIKAIEAGWFQQQIADSAYETARKKGRGEHVVIGVNRHVDAAGDTPVEVHKVDPSVEARQTARVKEGRACRDQARVTALLDRLAREAAEPRANLMPTTIELVKARATMGEIVLRLKDVWGRYVERPVF
jgi:methylmalonyl-CoA mutase cobalamin-binding domain/chain